MGESESKRSALVFSSEGTPCGPPITKVTFCPSSTQLSSFLAKVSDENCLPVASRTTRRLLGGIARARRSADFTLLTSRSVNFFSRVIKSVAISLIGPLGRSPTVRKVILIIRANVSKEKPVFQEWIKGGYFTLDTTASLRYYFAAFLRNCPLQRRVFDGIENFTLDFHNLIDKHREKYTDVRVRNFLIWR